MRPKSSPLAQSPSVILKSLTVSMFLNCFWPPFGHLLGHLKHAETKQLLITSLNSKVWKLSKTIKNWYIGLQYCAIFCNTSAWIWCIWSRFPASWTPRSIWRSHSSGTSGSPAWTSGSRHQALRSPKTHYPGNQNKPNSKTSQTIQNCMDWLPPEPKTVDFPLKGIWGDNPGYPILCGKFQGGLWVRFFDL